MRLILASASPRRADLLRAAGFVFETYRADVDEGVRPNESPSEYVQRLADEKAAAVEAAMVRSVGQAASTKLEERSRFGEADDVIVLGADTAVVVNGTILGKPQDDVEAAAMLRQLSGRRHEVMTGVSVRAGAREAGCVETTTVQFSTLTEDDIAWYVRSGEGRDKAGAYAIQGLASRFIPRIEGSYSNVVGLPVAAVAELLRAVERRIRP
jgi:septum formation protein